MSKFPVDAWLQKSLEQLALTIPTPVQSECIPQILAGKDCIASAKTGSGKTAAFALPILNQLAKDPFGVFALVITPTRELAFQIAEQFRVLGSGINLKFSIVVGGLDMMTQAIELARKPHIIVATPGRLVDHIRSSHEAVDLKRLRFLVLDEADRLLSDSFGSDLNFILDNVPEKRQTLLFSATMTEAIESLKFAKSTPFVYRGNTCYDTIDKLDQRYLFVPYTVRDAYLTHLLRAVYGLGSPEKTDVTSKRPTKRLKTGTPRIEKTEDTITSVIIFTGKWKICERLYLQLRELNIRCTALHSRLSQADRLSSIAKFKSGLIPILITTDVGSRGLDIPSVKVVINYDLPADATDYIHRIGRTARAGRGGLSLSMISERDVDVLLNIEGKIGMTKTMLISIDKKLVEYTEIEEKDALLLLDEVSLAKRLALMAMSGGEDIKSKFGRKLRSSYII